ncbi:nuclear RNA export factor 1-like [Linepithema humile]|uniref:nuclear RNA export factor 1-like n=1 Tax=Linepithema humile TaxID=83485 RepID=UPI000623483D|nr:PREDICTED: nuclear RNA export factor 1-like [Linepithema humile]
MNKLIHPAVAQQPVPLVPIQLDSAIAIRIAMGAKMANERLLMAHPDIWHQIRIIRGAQYDKETILKAILKAIEPFDLIPVKYDVCGDDAYFMARNCGFALEKLCKTNLIINNVQNDAVILMIILGYSSIQNTKIHIQPVLLAALAKRYDPNQKILNLRSFHKDPNIESIVYCPLSLDKMSNHVLKLAKNAIATIEYLNLQYNELFNITAIENSELTFIKYLDLRNNNLLNMNVLAPLQDLKIIKLWLDGNPLCENYATAKRYVENAKKYCPYLQELDGVTIVSNMPFIYRDYFKDEKALDFVRKFASHFFTLYDQLDRTVLRGIYHKNAFYSMSFGIPNSMAQKKNLVQYTGSRNLLRKGPKKNSHLYYGQEDILANLIKMPRTYHDKNSFKYDIMYDDGKCIVINITGLFKKLSSGTNILSFSRTFVLLAAMDNEYHILNDQNHIDAAPQNMTPDQIAVKYTYDEFVPTCFSLSEKSVLITRMKQITKMNDEWCKNYLSENEWDTRKAVNSFMKDLKNSSIPDLAFHN